MKSWAAQVVSVQTSVKAATRIDTQKKDGAEGEHYQNSKGQDSKRQQKASAPAHAKYSNVPS